MKELNALRSVVTLLLTFLCVIFESKMSASKLKITPPPKLEGKNLTIDKLQTWFSGLKNCFKHDKDHKQFLKGEAFETWSALKTDSTRGIRVDPGYEQDDDAATKAEKDATAEEKAVKIRDSLDDFLLSLIHI